jgi:hypothetical protein
VSETPHEFEIEFGLKLSADARVVIAHAGAEARHGALSRRRVTSNGPRRSCSWACTTAGCSSSAARVPPSVLRSRRNGRRRRN